MKEKSQGNVMDLVTIGISILAMSIVVMTYLQATELIMKKLEVSQLSRKYILIMETEGYLSQQNSDSLMRELQRIGVQGIDIAGTTVHPVAYGDAIYLQIKGTINAKTVDNDAGGIWYEGFQAKQIPLAETRMSTAKY